MNNISYSTDEDDTYLKYDEDIKKEEIDGAEINKLENEMYKENLDIIEDENNEEKEENQEKENDENHQEEEKEKDDENQEEDRLENDEHNKDCKEEKKEKEKENDENQEEEKEKDDKKIEYFCDDIHLKILNYVNFTNYKMENIVFYSMIFGFLTVIPVLKNL